MATVRVSFLLGGERFHGRLNRSSVLSDVPAKATRVNRARPGYKVIRLRRLSHTRQYGTDQAVFLRRDGRGQSFPLCLQPQLGRKYSIAFPVRNGRAKAAREGLALLRCFNREPEGKYCFAARVRNFHFPTVSRSQRPVDLA